MTAVKISNLRDAIAALQEVAQFLESIKVSQTTAGPRSKHMPKGEAGRKKKPPDIKALYESIRSLPRPELLHSLTALSAATLHSLSYLIGLKGMSKRPKDEMVKAIVRELIDFSEEHQRLRTFSERKTEEIK